MTVDTVFFDKIHIICQSSSLKIRSSGAMAFLSVVHCALTGERYHIHIYIYIYILNISVAVHAYTHIYRYIHVKTDRLTTYQKTRCCFW
jgi:hypothetical protein